MAVQALVVISAATVVAVLHMVAPDHWLPLTVLAERYGFSSARRHGLAALIGLAHGALSSILAAAALYVSASLAGGLATYINEAGVALLAALEGYYLASGLREGNSSAVVGGSSLGVSVVPDPALVSLLSAQGLGWWWATAIMAAFTAASSASLLLVAAVASTAAGASLRRLRPSQFDCAVAAVMFALALYIYLSA